MASFQAGPAGAAEAADAAETRHPTQNRQSLQAFALEDVDHNLRELCLLPPNNSNGQERRSIPKKRVRAIQKILERLDKGAGRYHNERWSLRPRLYGILLNIGALTGFMDLFINDQYTDFYLPFTQYSLPVFIKSQSLRNRFLDVQQSFLTGIKDFEAENEHMNLAESGDDYLASQKGLGQGGFGAVDLVLSGPNKTSYARKRVLRGRGYASALGQNALLVELQELRKLEHQHLVSIRGSYTDKEYIAYLMTPVADCTLAEFLGSSRPLKRPEKIMLRQSYGCLAGVVNYLHDKKIRHRDITARNVLVFNNQVIVSDFGSAYNWADQPGSRTDHRSTSVSQDYMAPEMAQQKERGRSSDMWSLGIVFLEMTTALLGKRVSDFRGRLEQHSKETNVPAAHPSANLPAVFEWIEMLEAEEDTSSEQHDREPLGWIRELLHERPEHRLTAKQLMKEISESSSLYLFRCLQCQPSFQHDAFAYADSTPSLGVEYFERSSQGTGTSDPQQDTEPFAEISDACDSDSDSDSDTSMLVPAPSNGVNRAINPKSTGRARGREKEIQDSGFEKEEDQKEVAGKEIKRGQEARSTPKVVVDEAETKKTATDTQSRAASGTSKRSRRRTSRVIRKRMPFQRIDTEKIMDDKWNAAETMTEHILTSKYQYSGSWPKRFSMKIEIGSRAQGFLEEACTRSDVMLVRAILERAARERWELSLHQPMVCAAREGTSNAVHCMRLLLNAGASPKSQANNGESVLHVAVGMDRTFSENIVWMLLGADADLNCEDANGETPMARLFSKNTPEKPLVHSLIMLLKAARWNNETAAGVLLHAGARADSINAKGLTPLLLAAAGFRVQLDVDQATVLDYLLRADGGAEAVDIAEGKNGRTALHQAVVAGGAQAVEMLLNARASPTIPDKLGNDAVMLAILYAEKLTVPRRDSERADDYEARIEAHMEIMQRLSDATGAAWPTDQGMCAVEVACRRRDTNLLKQLLDKNMCPDARFGNESVRTFAARCGSEEARRILKTQPKKIRSIYMTL